MAEVTFACAAAGEDNTTAAAAVAAAPRRHALGRERSAHSAASVHRTSRSCRSMIHLVPWSALLASLGVIVNCGRAVTGVGVLAPAATTDPRGY